MISFVWPSFMPFVTWAGGTEAYTLGQLRELQRRGIEVRMIACTKMVADSFAQYPDIPLLTLRNEAELSELDDTLLFVMHPIHVSTRHQAYVILHVPIKGPIYDDSNIFAGGIGTIKPIVTSKYMAAYWKDVLHLKQKPAVVYPFADEVFSTVVRPARTSSLRRLLFAGRPTQEKGVFTLLASLHVPPLRTAEFSLTSVLTMNHLGDADAINALFKAHPRIQTIPPAKDRTSMARIYAAYDIVVMPSSGILWKEAFGMIAVEAQHAGCRVVASDDGGLPETDCGGLLLVPPDDPVALAEGVTKALALKPLTKRERHIAGTKFTVAESVDTLLSVIDPHQRS
jgi:D-inositol-3-phosphate glycosyltransferase